MLNSLRTAVRNLGRPVVSAARRALTPSEPAARLEFVEIRKGPAAGLRIRVPVPSKLADKFASNEYETCCVDLLQSLIRPSDVCFDIGAHYGYFTLLLARLASEGQVHSFEPVSRLVETIRQSIGVNSIENAVIHPIGLSSESGERTFRFAPDDSRDDSMGYLVDHGGTNTDRSQIEYANFSELRIHCESLDRLELPLPSFIKIDAEGAEAAILSGSRNLIQRCKPRLLIELHGVDLALECAEILRSMEYLAIPIGPRSLTMPILWVHRQDSQALVLVKRLQGDNLRILFSPPAGSPGDV